MKITHAIRNGLFVYAGIIAVFLSLSYLYPTLGYIAFALCVVFAISATVYYFWIRPAKYKKWLKEVYYKPFRLQGGTIAMYIQVCPLLKDNTVLRFDAYSDRRRIESYKVKWVDEEEGFYVFEESDSDAEKADRSPKRFLVDSYRLLDMAERQTYYRKKR